MTVDLSIVIPVLNEKKNINTTIKRLYDQKFSRTLEIIVVDGSSSGDTLACIKYDKVIRVVSLPGRGRQMNAGACAAKGSVLLFLHCDTALPENGLEKIVNKMEEKECDAGAFDLSIDSSGFAYRMIEKTASIRSRLTGIPYGDQAVFIRKTYFFSIGRFKEIPIMEDVELMQRIKKKGGRIQFVDDCILTSSRRWEKEGKLYGTLRNWLIIILYYLGMSPEKIAGLYKNH